MTIFEGTYSQRRQERERLAALRAVEKVKVNAPRLARRSADPALKAERRRVARLQELENKIGRVGAATNLIWK